MRRRLVVLTLATTWMVALAFLVPLALLVRDLARNRALTSAELEAQSLAPVLALTDDPAALEPAVGATTAGAAGRLSLVLPDGRVLGAPLPEGGAASLDLARRGRTFSTAAPGGTEVLVPVVRPDASIAVVRVLVPAEVLRRGVGQAWAVLAGLGVVLVGLAVAVADRMARSVVRPVEALATAAGELGQGDLGARVRVAPGGPRELAEVGEAFNRLAARVAELLAAERERVADLSHRLRTPLTALRLDAETLDRPEDRARIVDDVAEVEQAVDRVIVQARRGVREAVTSDASCDLAQVAGERVAFWAALADEQQRPWSLDTPPVAVAAPVHRDDLEAALDALLGNVFAHTPDGTAFRVVVRAGPGGGGRVVVEDDGPGLGGAGGDVLARGVSGAGSTGLGLDIARRTAEDAGGSLVVGVGGGGGARVELVFPPPAGASSTR